MIKKEFYSLKDWTIANVRIDSKRKSYNYLEQSGLPHPKVMIFDYSELSSNRVADFIRNYYPTLVFVEPKQKNLKVSGRFNIESISQLAEFMDEFSKKDLYSIVLMQMVLGVEGGYVGTALSDGDEKVLIEILKEDNITDIRKLTSTGANPLKLENYFIKNGYLKSEPTKIQKFEVYNISNHVKNHVGYFEFVKGSINNIQNVYFTDYQSGPQFIKILQDIN